MLPDVKHIHDSTPQRNLLLVDDEENISRSLVRLLKRDNYNIYTASSGLEGLEILRSNEIGVIISDQRMPEMSGTEFLSLVSKEYPDTIRIVLSGYTELKAVTGAINEGKIYKFFTKPWDDDLLRQNIKEAFRQYELLSENHRLNHELEVANQDLKQLNVKLANSVKVESRSAEISLRSLQVAQDVLQNLPIGILGIDEEKTIVLANNMAHEIFSGVSSGLIGDSADQVLPVSVNDCPGDAPLTFRHSIIKIGGHVDVNVILYRQRILNDADSVIAVVIPIEGM